MKEFIMLNILICAVTGDLLDYKIRNPVIIAGWAAGIFFNAFSSGFSGIFHTIFCIVITIIAGFPVFMAGGAYRTCYGERGAGENGANVECVCGFL